MDVFPAHHASPALVAGSGAALLVICAAVVAGVTSTEPFGVDGNPVPGVLLTRVMEPPLPKTSTDSAVAPSE